MDYLSIARPCPAVYGDVVVITGEGDLVGCTDEDITHATGVG